MEPGDSGSRPSVHPNPAIITEQHQRHHQPSPSAPPTSYQSPREHLERRYQEQHAMATATVLAPSSHYPQSSSYSSYPQHQTGTAPPPPSTSGSNMISSEHRRSSDDKEQPGRQSLPSISEVISGTRPGQYPPPSQPNLQPGSGLPSPFTPAPRSYSEPEKHSPRQLHTSSTYPPRQENLPAFTDSPRPPFNGRHSLPPVSDRRQTPPSKPDFPQHRLAESQQPSDAHASNGAYGHPPPPTSHPYPAGHLPPGQVPLPTYPISPRHAVPPPPGQYDARGQSVRHEEAEYPSRPRFEPTPTRHFEPWNYQEALSHTGSASRTLLCFAEAYGRIAQEQHGSHPLPERLPTEREVNDMLGNIDIIKRCLEQVRDAVQVSIQNERAREGTKIKGAFEEHQDVSMYDNGMKSQYTMTEVKKRRGRAAPPGRCHSCNRIDTPEWRRGPDGARTLCNACGLHYAKLERKRQLEARSLRPKPEDRN